jgi:hypothetical protein
MECSKESDAPTMVAAKVSFIEASFVGVPERFVPSTSVTTVKQGAVCRGSSLLHSPTPLAKYN